jgi:HEPN domain-containing protein
MKPRTAEWVEKAEGDWNAARQLNRVRKDPNYDSVCFHCQQSVEKYLKARLEEAGVNFPKTHDLIKLLGLSIAVEPRWVALHPLIATLNP